MVANINNPLFNNYGNDNVLCPDYSAPGRYIATNALYLSMRLLKIYPILNKSMDEKASFYHMVTNLNDPLFINYGNDNVLCPGYSAPGRYIATNALYLSMRLLKLTPSLISPDGLNSKLLSYGSQFR